MALIALVGSLAPPALAANGLSITTDYPAVAVAPGSKASFNLSVETDREARIDLAVVSAPDGWTATLHGGGYVVDGVFATPDKPSEVRLDVTVPADATGTQRISVRATDGSRTATIDLDVRVATSAAGDVLLTTEFPELRGPSDATFRFNLTLRNDTPEDLTFAVTASGPRGWQVEAKVTSQQQAASATVKSGSTVGLEVTAKPPTAVEAGRYPIAVTAASGTRDVQAELSVEVTGTYAMTLTTPDDRLSTRGSAGSEIRQALRIRNDGSAPLENVTFASTAPSGWRVTFEPEMLVSIAPSEFGEVTAVIVPSGDAIAGDYVVTMRSSTDQANASRDIRVTVETSMLWGLIGAMLIGGVLVGLGWVFRRYGRR